MQTSTEKIKLTGYKILQPEKRTFCENFFFPKQHFIFFVIKHEPFEVKRSMRLFKNKQKWLDKTVCFNFLRNYNCTQNKFQKCTLGETKLIFLVCEQDSKKNSVHWLAK